MKKKLLHSSRKKDSCDVTKGSNPFPNFCSHFFFFFAGSHVANRGLNELNEHFQ